MSYTGIACPDMKKDGACVRGELCPYAHNVFEYWLHPTRCITPSVVQSLLSIAHRIAPSELLLAPSLIAEGEYHAFFSHLQKLYFTAVPDNCLWWASFCMF